METNFNLSSLKTIQIPLLESLNSAHENVKKNISIYVDEKKIPTDYSAIGTILELKKIYKMIGLHSLAVVFNLNSEALKKVKEIDFDTETNIKVLKAVENILDKSRVYIKSLINGSLDQPTKFYHDYKSLADVIRKEVSIKDLFNPRLELKENVPSTIKDELRRGVIVNQANKKSLLENLKVIENVYISRLIDFKKMLSNRDEFFASEQEKEKYTLSCKNIYEKFDIAQKLKISKSYYIFFGLCKFYVCMISPSLNENFKTFVSENSNSIEENLDNIRNVLIELFKDIEASPEGSKSGVFKPNDKAIKDILYSIINAVKENSALMELKVYSELTTYFNLDSYAEQLVDIKMQNVNISKINFANIEKIFAELKEEVILIGAKKKGPEDLFKQHLAKIINLTNKLAESVMSVKEVHVLVSQMAATLAKIRSGSINLSDEIERELAIALVLIQYGVANIIKGDIENKYKSEFGSQAQIEVARIKLAEENNIVELSNMPMPQLDSLSQKNDEKKSFSKIFEQVSVDLTFVEETLDLIINKKSDGLQGLDQSIKSLKEMKGIFSVIGKVEIVSALNEAIMVWEKIKEIPESITDEIRESIIIISGISLLVKSLRSENEVEADEIYENIIHRYKTGLFKPEEEKEPVLYLGQIEIASFENAGVVIEENKEQNLVEKAPVTLVIRNKDEIIEDFNNLFLLHGKTAETSVLLSLVDEYLKSISVESKMFEVATSLIKLATNINLELNQALSSSEIQSLLDIENLEISFKNKKLSQNIRDEIKEYSKLIGAKEITNVSKSSLKLHEDAENILNGIFSHAVLINLPYFEVAKEEDKNITVNIENGSLKAFIEGTNDEELGEIFIGEASEVLIEMHDGVLSLANGYDKETLTVVRRNFHTLKGSGRMVGLEYWGEAAWMTEQTLNKVLSGEIEWSNSIFEAVKEMKIKFEKWLSDLKSINSINVDLVSVKIMWQGLNDKLTNHIEIVIPEILNQVDVPLIEVGELPNITFKFEEKEATIDTNDINLDLEKSVTIVDDLMNNEKNVEIIKESNSEYINIHGKSIAVSLYKLYKEESITNINSLKEFVKENYKNVRLDDDFMRYAHTLASISKTVNIQKVASIAVVLEDIAYFALERDVLLNAEQMNIVRHAVDSLELFQDINTSTDTSFYENILQKLNDLYEELESSFVENESLSMPISENLGELITIENLNLLIDEKVKLKIVEIQNELEEKQSEHFKGIKKEVLENVVKSFEDRVYKLALEIEKKYMDKVKDLNIQAKYSYENLEDYFKKKEEELKKSYEISLKNIEEQLKKSFDDEKARFKEIEKKLNEDINVLNENLNEKNKKVSFWEKLLGRR